MRRPNSDKLNQKSKETVNRNLRSNEIRRLSAETQRNLRSLEQELASLLNDSNSSKQDSKKKDAVRPLIGEGAVVAAPINYVNNFQGTRYTGTVDDLLKVLHQSTPPPKPVVEEQLVGPGVIVTAPITIKNEYVGYDLNIKPEKSSEESAQYIPNILSNRIIDLVKKNYSFQFTRSLPEELNLSFLNAPRKERPDINKNIDSLYKLIQKTFLANNIVVDSQVNEDTILFQGSEVEINRIVNLLKTALKEEITHIPVTSWGRLFNKPRENIANTEEKEEALVTCQIQ